MRYICTAVVATLVLAGTSFAATINVPADYTTIQAAIDAASDGDVILVAPGTHTGTGNEVISVSYKAITIKASGTPEETIIDGEGARRVCRFGGGIGAGTIIEGFTITGGYGDGGAGMVFGYSSPTITNCTISGNTSWPGDGGGIVCQYSSSPTFIGCTISDNTAWQAGGGIYNAWSNPAVSPTLTDTVVCGNDPDQIDGCCWNDGGGNTVADECDPDSDGDGVADGKDNCYLYNPDQADCNENGIGDVCDIADGVSEDINGNEIPDECDCLADVVVDGEVNINDVLVTISSWGTSGPLGDVNYDGIVDVEDLLIVISAWGPCP